MNNKLFKVGQEAYILNKKDGYNSPQIIEVAVVEKVGRKYITVKKNWELFEFELGHTKNGVVKLPRKEDGYTHFMHLFMTRKDAENERERNCIITELRRNMNSSLLDKMNLSDLQTIKQTVDLYKNMEV